MRHAICYVSNVDEDLDLEEIKGLLEFCLQENQALDIKGLLLYSEGNFFQILEGEKQVVQEVFERINNDTRHHGIIQIIGRDIEKGSYDSYKVGILTENEKHQEGIPLEYAEALKGIDPGIKRVMERMLDTFIETR